MEHPVDAQAARRVIQVGRIALVWAVLIFGRLIYLQVIKHDDFVKAARAQQQHKIEIPADRGEILDRTGAPLAISIRTESVVVNPQRVKDPAFFSSVVAPALQLDPKTLSATLDEYQDRGAKHARSRGFLMLKRHIDAAEKDRLQYLMRTFPLEIVRDSRREYPIGMIGAHVVGSLDAEGGGNAGIEQKLNEELRGKPGKMTVLTGSQQDHYVSWVSEDSLDGVNLTLSVHRVIQHDAERFLEEGIRAAGAQSGTVLVMDPQNGEILALANYPSFDPRHEKPSEAEASARHSNIAVQIPCEPGSVMKMITVTMGIDSGRFTPETQLYCENGVFPRPNRKPIHDVHRYGTLDVAGVLIKSSNIGVAKISLASGPKLLYEYLKKFGIGDKTGIELPAESRGMLRKQECSSNSDTNCWSASSHEYIAFGHEVAATAVQLGRAVSVIASGGLLVQPHLVIRRVRPHADGRMERIPVAYSEPKRVLRAETAFTIRRIMERVVLEGTGKAAAIPGYSSGGKTGSAQMFENGAWLNQHNSSFIGFAPVTNPRVVVVVTMNRTPKLGGVAAAPVFRNVAESALRVMQVPKDRPETDPPARKPAPLETNELPQYRMARAEQPAALEPPPAGPELAGPRVPDFRGKPVLNVLRQSAAMGLPVEILGQGTARMQKPAPGAILPAGGKVQVEFSNTQ
jgi:cell division protein FtsI (penicillin-binding protein 3)